MAIAVPEREREEVSEPVVLRLKPLIELTDEQFFALCQMNDPYRMERTAEGDIVIMAPASSEGSTLNNELSWQLTNWAKQDGTGRVFDSSSGYILPHGATRSPDASWVLRSRIDALTPQQKSGFLPLAPDFAAELMSPTDSLTDLRAKMEEYMANGVRLGILVQPKRRRVTVYRPGQEPVTMDDPAAVSCEPEFPGLSFNMADIFGATL
jgi:Uma2 family endonuclease